MSIDKDTIRVCDQLGRYVGWTHQISAVVRRLVTEARKYERIQERWCNDEMTDAETARVEKREAALEDRIRGLAFMLPATDEGGREDWKVRFDGDPRGYVVTLVDGAGNEIGVG